VKDQAFYKPSDQGYEQHLAERVEMIRKLQLEYLAAQKGKK
jgi:hypothetical protein